MLPLSHGDDDDDLEEERRLFYVGVTRGIEKVTISYANSRRRFGQAPCSHFALHLLIQFQRNYVVIILILNRLIKVKHYFLIEIESNKKTPSDKINEFAVHDMVQHKLYGNGKITNIEGIGDNSKITIQFRGNIIKKFIKKYANLKNIN